MGIDTTEQQSPEAANGGPKRRRNQDLTPAEPVVAPTSWADNLREGLRHLEWPKILMFGIPAGILMPLSLTQASFLSFFAGIVPVGAGLLLARRVKGYYALQGFFAGVIGAIIAVALLGYLVYYTPTGTIAPMASAASADAPVPTKLELWTQLGGFIAFSLVVFCSFGASMAGRAETRNKALRAEADERGGTLQRPDTIREVADLRGLSLPQFGGYINNLFKKQGFKLVNYKFIDKDKHLDIWMEREGEPWHLRLSVADKVSAGTVEGLAQRMKDEGVRKGVVLASTEFAAGAQKSAKGRPIVLIDGPTLFEIAEG